MLIRKTQRTPWLTPYNEYVSVIGKYVINHSFKNT